MPIDDKLKVRRDQLAKFIDEHDTLRQFERLFELVNSLEINGIETLEEMILRVHQENP